jgi:hypothetical protein
MQQYVKLLKRFSLSEFCMGSTKWLNPWTLNNDADNDNNGCEEQSHCSASRNILSFTEPGGSLSSPQQPANGGHIILIHITTTLLWRDAASPGRNLPTFRRNILPPSSCSKTSPRSTQIHCCLLGLLRDPEDWGSILSRNYDKCLPDYLTPQPRRQHSSIRSNRQGSLKCSFNIILPSPTGGDDNTWMWRIRCICCIMADCFSRYSIAEHNGLDMMTAVRAVKVLLII